MASPLEGVKSKASWGTGVWDVNYVLTGLTTNADFYLAFYFYSYPYVGDSVQLAVLYGVCDRVAVPYCVRDRFEAQAFVTSWQKCPAGSSVEYRTG
jgi:hypothetical protein